MKRMKCIGAQAVPVSELTMPRPRAELPCRRGSGDGEHRTFVTAHPMDNVAAMSALQLSLFEEPVADGL
jgi:hypothetical protein